MGVIQRQSTKRTMIDYLGVFIASISTLFIYTLDKEIYGYAQFLFGAAHLFIPLASLGALSLVVKFFPKFKNDHNKHNGFFMTMCSIILVGFIVFLVLAYFFRDPFLNSISFLGMDAELIKENGLLIVLLAFAIIISFLLQNHISNFHRIVVPAIVKTLAYKIFLPSIFLTCFFGYISLEQLGWGMVLFFSTVNVVLLLYLRSLGHLSFKTNFKFIKPGLRKEMGSYMVFGALNQIGASLSLRIDTLMIPIMVGLTGNGIYNILFFISSAIAIPSRGLTMIASPIISSSWENKDYTEISNVYRRSSIALLTIGGFFFVVLWYSLDPLFSFTKDADEILAYKSIFIFLGVAKLINLATSVNNQILVYSDKYKYNLLFLFFLGISNVLLNYYMIGEFGLLGAAIATAFSVFLFNLIKYLFIWYHFKMQPFNWNTVKVLIIMLVVFSVLYFIPKPQNSILHLAVIFVISGLLYFPLVFKLQVSADINQLLKSKLGKFGIHI